MKRIRTLKITQTRRLLIRPPLVVPCFVCARQVEALTTAEALEVLAADELTLAAFVAAGQVHSLRTITGRIHICKDSLFAPKPLE